MQHGCLGRQPVVPTCVGPNTAANASEIKPRPRCCHLRQIERGSVLLLWCSCSRCARRRSAPTARIRCAHRLLLPRMRLSEPCKGALLRTALRSKRFAHHDIPPSPSSISSKTGAWHVLSTPTPRAALVPRGGHLEAAATPQRPRDESGLVPAILKPGTTAIARKSAIAHRRCGARPPACALGVSGTPPRT